MEFTILRIKLISVSNNLQTEGSVLGQRSGDAERQDNDEQYFVHTNILYIKL